MISRTLTCYFLFAAPLLANYTFQTIDYPLSPNSPPSSTVATAVSDNGQIAGYYCCASVGNPYTRGFVYTGGLYFDIYGITDSFNSPVTPFLNGINDNGVIVGNFTDAFSDSNGFVSSVHSDFTPINYPGLQLGYGSTVITGLNNSGAIVGNYADYTDNSGGGFLYQGGTFTPLSFTTYAINNNGQILGGDNSGLFIYTNGQHASLGALPFTPYGFNDAGTIVGSAGNAGYVYSGGTVTTLLVPGSLQTQAYGLNDDGAIVGSYIDAEGRQHGFLATTPEPGYLLTLTGGLGALAFWRKRSRINPTYSARPYSSHHPPA